jgi:hypothetical protein
MYTMTEFLKAYGGTPMRMKCKSLTYGKGPGAIDFVAGCSACLSTPVALPYTPDGYTKLWPGRASVLRTGRATATPPLLITHLPYPLISLVTCECGEPTTSGLSPLAVDAANLAIKVPDASPAGAICRVDFTIAVAATLPKTRFCVVNPNAVTGFPALVGSSNSSTEPGQILSVSGSFMQKMMPGEMAQIALTSADEAKFVGEVTEFSISAYVLATVEV